MEANPQGHPPPCPSVAFVRYSHSAMLYILQFLTFCFIELLHLAPCTLHLAPCTVALNLELSWPERGLLFFHL